jgi:Na+/H+ antiporter NhaA
MLFFYCWELSLVQDGVFAVFLHVISSNIPREMLASQLAAWIIQQAFGWLPSVARILDCLLHFFT